MPERRNELLRRLEELKPKLIDWLAKDSFDHHALDALYLETFMLDYGRKLGEGGTIGVHRKKDAPSRTQPLLDSAQFEVVPNKLLCLVPKEFTWEADAIVWLEPEQVGLPANARPCVNPRRSQHP